MKQRHVRFTATARQQVRREKTWWSEKRIYAEVFAGELEHALRVLAFLPGAGTPYTNAKLRVCDDPTCVTLGAISTTHLTTMRSSFAPSGVSGEGAAQTVIGDFEGRILSPSGLSQFLPPGHG